MSVTLDATKINLLSLSDEIDTVNGVIEFLKEACIAVATTRGERGDISDSGANGLKEIFLWVNERLENVSDQVKEMNEHGKRPKMN